MEKDWTQKQKQFHEIQILEKIQKGKNQAKYTQKCLQQCKGWNGPATSVEELHMILKSNADKREKIVRMELSFYRDTHKADAIQQPDLFRINNISFDDHLLNLCALPADQDPARDYLSLPSNSDAATILSSNSTDSTSDISEDTIKVGKYYITLITEESLNTWYIASCEGKNSDGTYEMDHLTRVQKGSNLVWKHPVKADKIDLHNGSIVECPVDGEWDVSQERNMTFTLRNHVYITNLVQNIITG